MTADSGVVAGRLARQRPALPLSPLQPTSHDDLTTAPAALRPALSSPSRRRTHRANRLSVVFDESAQTPAIIPRSPAPAPAAAPDRNPPPVSIPLSPASETSSSRDESGESGADPEIPAPNLHLHIQTSDYHLVDTDMTDGDTSSPPREQTPPKVKRTRTRTGCLNCRRKKRKCDEARPACGGCSRRGEPCRWGIKVTFRADNAQTIPGDHPSMRPRRRRPRQFEIMDVTDEVIRDYHLPPSCSLGDHERESEDDDSYDIEVLSPQETSTTVPPALPTPTSYQDGDGHGLSFITAGRKHSPSPSSQVVTDNAVANLLYFSQGGPGDTTNADAPPLLPPLDALPMEPLVGANNPFHPFDFGDHLFTPEGSLEDGIFLPGSAFQELHSTLRNHLIQEVKSNGPTRPCSPAVTINPEDEPGTCTGASTLPPVCPSPDPAVRTPRELSTDHEPPELSGEEECLLWNNWFEEISPWLDKFDTERHFQHVLPGMARSHDHLRYSMLALSARQRELKSASRATDLSLSLYQEAIHLLLPQLSIRSTPVIASCIVLCVLEMCSCSPKAWRRHLDGCASLMEAVGMTGFDGGLEQALFWCFARMDVCGGLISSVKTLIPTGHWASRVDMAADAALFRRSAPGSFAMWANYAVYLCAQVLDLLAPLAQANPGGLFFEGPRHDADYRAEWLALWRLVDEWHASRPAEMCHVFALASTPTNPFPAVVYSNSAAISGNQMYHTAALLMLQNKPASLRLGQKSKSALWHARQICAISLSNHHHGAWTNSIQPLWIAGRCMSHPAEHKAILELYAKIERESGWSTKWRADDLQDFWGDLAEDDE